MTKRARKKENGKRRIHNTAKESKLARIKKKLLGKTNWYKKRMDRDDHEKPHIGRKMMSNQGDNLKTRAVLFVEQTPQGELARRLKEQLQRLEHQGEFFLVASIKVKFLASVTKNVVLSF